MKAKNKRAAPPSMHDRVKAHMEAEAEARKQATEGIALAKSGKATAAKAAARKAEDAHRRMLELEAIDSHMRERPDDPH